MHDWILNLANNHSVFVYAAIIIVAIVEGPILSILLGALIKGGLFHFWPIYFSLMAGDVIGDVGWYYIGRHFGIRFVNRFGKYFGITAEKIEKVTRIFHKYHEKILVISKLTSGFGFAVVTLMVAGITKIPFGRYITINFLGQFFWTGFLIAVGYFLGHLYETVSSILGKISIGVLFVVILIAMNEYRKYVGNQMARSSV